jgi:hypothetical protein
MGCQCCSHLCGLHRARVLAVNGLRLQVSVPELSGGQPLGWALPCAQPGTQAPVVGSVVWVMFERGDALHPVWMGTMPSA